LKELRRKAKGEEEKASMELMKKMQEEEKGKARGKKADPAKEAPSRATKKKKA